MGNLKFGDIYTKDLDLIIQAPPVYNFPAKDVTIEHIPGRNGDLIIDNKCWQNVERTYSIASVFRPGTNFINNSEKLIKWLTSTKGYQRLEDTYDPLVYRMAVYKNSGSLQNYYDQATALNVTFDCKPQRYLKEGDLPISFSGSSALLKNPTGKPSLPKIVINKLNLVDSNKKTILLTVTNNGVVISTISLSKYPFNNIILDSDLQTATYNYENDDIKDANKYICLNGKDFPVLDSGETSIKLSGYSENEILVSKYENIINAALVDTQNHKTCLALYKPKDAIIESKQQSIYIQSYSLLKQKLEDTYEAESYANYCMRKSESYTFISYNTILGNSCQTYSFQTDYSSAPEWLSISINSQDSSKIDVRVGSLSSFQPYNTSIAYFISNNDKKIRKLHNGDLIGTFSLSTTVTVTVYPADSSQGNLAVDYSDYNQPSWLGFTIKYDSDGSPESIIFTSNATGYYYLPKSGLFGKAKWQLISSNGTELTKFIWSSSKKAFMPSGISNSTNVSIEYHFIPKPYTPQGGPYLQYEPIYRDVLDENGSPKKDANGNVIQEIDEDVYFYIVPTDDLSKYSIYAKSTGYFRMNDDDQTTGWRKIISGNIIKSNVESDKSNVIYHFSDKPDYPSDDFSDWLSNVPILTGSQGSDIDPTSVDFKVLKAGWYRYTYEENGNTKYTEWVYREANTNLGQIYPAPEIRDPNMNTTVYRLEGSSDEFPVKEYSYIDSNGDKINDIGFFYLDENGKQVEYPNNTPPSWLEVDVVIDGDSKLLVFNAKKLGLYKWDNNSVWINKDANSEIVTSTAQDDTSIYFLDSLPQYPTYDQISIDINENTETGNPEFITIKANTNGYFRAKNASNWVYYTVGQEICTSKISENTEIHYLTDDGSVLDDITINITPRWWML